MPISGSVTCSRSSIGGRGVLCFAQLTSLIDRSPMSGSVMGSRSSIAGAAYSLVPGSIRLLVRTVTDQRLADELALLDRRCLVRHRSSSIGPGQGSRRAGALDSTRGSVLLDGPDRDERLRDLVPFFDPRPS